jgi:hypothetical protein
MCAHASVSLFYGPRLPVSLPSFNRSPARTVRTNTEIAAPTSPPSAKLPSRPPPQLPAHTHFSSGSFISPLHTHPSCACPFFKLVGAPPSTGLLRPNPPLAELDHHPQPCSATARHNLAVVLASPEVNFLAGLLLSPLFYMFHQLAAGDRRYWNRAVVSRPPGQPQLPHAFFAHVELPAPATALAPCARPRKTAVLTRRTHLSASPISPLLRSPRMVTDRWTLGPTLQRSA